MRLKRQYPEKECAHPECNVRFVPTSSHLQKRYCSPRCAREAPERRQKISTKLKAIGHGYFMLGRKLSLATRQKMSEVKKGKVFTREHRENLSRAGCGRIQSAESIQKIRESHLRTGHRPPATPLGTKLSEEHKQKIRAALNKLDLSALRKGKKPTVETRRKLSALRSGPKSHFWIDGRSRENKKRYWNLEYRIWRSSVFERDQYTCQTCGQRGGYLTAHHIKSFAHHAALRYELSNGLTLCEPCHEKTDNYKSRAKQRKL